MAEAHFEVRKFVYVESQSEKSLYVDLSSTDYHFFKQLKLFLREKTFSNKSLSKTLFEKFLRIH